MSLVVGSNKSLALQSRFMWRKREFYGVILQCFARVKRGDMSGFGKCCDCRKSHLLCDLRKVLTDKTQVCAVELVLPEYFVPNIKRFVSV